MKQLKITQGNDFVIYLPLVLLNSSGTEAVNTNNMTDVVVTVKRACASAITLTPTYVQNYMVLSFSQDMALGDYDANIKFKLSGVDKSVQINKFFGIVEYDYQSNWQDFIVGDHVVPETQAFIAGVHYTDADYTALKAQLTAKIAEVEAVKAEWLAKVAELTGLAKQGTNASATNTAILAAIQAIESGATEAEVQVIINNLKSALMGTNTAATLTAILAAIQEGGDVPIQEISSAQIEDIVERIITE